jgi:hypothetical protein
MISCNIIDSLLIIDYWYAIDSSDDVKRNNINSIGKY